MAPVDQGLGIRVVDLAGPAGFFCGRLLVGLGAEVVRVEPPGGESLRGDSLAFGHWHAGKRSVVLDLEAPAGRAALLALVATADVLVETVPSGHLERLGLDPATLLAARPELAIVS